MAVSRADTLEGKSERRTGPERDPEQRVGRLAAEQPDERVPGDRGQPLHRARQDDGLPERQPCQRHLTGTCPWSPGAKDGNGNGTDDRSEDDGSTAEMEPGPEYQRESARDAPGNLHDGRRPYRETHEDVAA